MTALESPKKNNDCYFYYYSTCARGDSCQFRHEPSALGCETVCSFWKEGKCLNIHCNFRHMELRKNRKAIPCYWESQPTGCLKAHCPFMHQHPRPDEEKGFDKLNDSSRSDSVFKDQSDRKVTAVDSLVVNCEEESDDESIPSFSPLKNINRIVRVKTLEEIRLEQIQAESAAFYSYHDEDIMESEDSADLRQRLVSKVPVSQEKRSYTPFYRNTTHDKIRANKRLSCDEMANILGDETLRKKPKLAFDDDDEEEDLDIIINRTPNISRVSNIPRSFHTIRNIPLKTRGNVHPQATGTIYRKTTSNIQNKTTEKVETLQEKTETTNIRIKTLAEIRAEKNAKNQPQEDVVTSTSIEDTVIQKPEDSIPKRKIKLRRKPILCDKLVVSTDVSEDLANKELVPMEDNSDSGTNIDEEVLLGDDDEFETIALRAEDDLLEDDDF